MKQSFSVKSIGISAGLTVGFKLVEQIKNGEKINIGKAVGYLATGEFVGSFVGSGLGSAAGAVVGTFASTIPVVGPVLGAFMPAIFSMAGGAIGAGMGNDLAAGQRPSFKKAWAAIDKVDLIGRAIGSTAGAAIGSMICPGIGTMIGGMIGGFIGGKVVELIRGKQGNKEVNIRYGAGPGGIMVNVAPSGAPAANPFPDKPGTVEGGFVPDKNTVSGENSDTKSLKDKMVAAYQTYAQLLSEGKGDSPEGQQALQNYKQAFNAYEAEMSKQGAPAASKNK